MEKERGKRNDFMPKLLSHLLKLGMIENKVNYHMLFRHFFSSGMAISCLEELKVDAGVGRNIQNSKRTRIITYFASTFTSVHKVPTYKQFTTVDTKSLKGRYEPTRWMI